MTDRDSTSGADATSVHVRRAWDGDAASTAWVVERFTPLLLAQARYRIGTRLRHVCDASDLVQDVWAIALPRLADLAGDDGAPTRKLVRFLSTTLLNRYRNVLKRHLRSRRGAANGDAAVPEELPAVTSGIVTRVAREERHDRLARALEMLGPAEREIVLLRGIEQASAREAASVLGLAPNTLTVRYRRALARLRSILGASVLDDLPDE